MTCHPFIVAATAAPTTPNAERAQLSAMGRAMDSQALQHGPAANTEALPMTGTAERIANRCKRMTFRSNEARKRYLAVQNLFASKTFSGDA